MDFNSQLAHLQRTAAAAAASSSGGGGGGESSRSPNRRRPRGEEQDRRHDSPHGRRQPYDHRHHKRRRGGGGRGDGPYHHNNRRPGLSRHDELKQAVQNLPQLQADAVSPSEDVSGCQHHVALLFLTIDELPYEHIWRAWMEQQQQHPQDSSSTCNLHVSVLCHAKFPHKVSSPWLRQRLLVEPPQRGRGHEYQAPTYHTHRPDWGSIEITRGMIDLLREAVRIGTSSLPVIEDDERFSTNRYLATSWSSESSHHVPIMTQGKLPAVQKFIFVSETCLPVATLSQVDQALFDKSEAASSNAVSWVNARNTPNNGYSRQLQFDKVHSVIAKEHIWKADQWMVLSRRHAKAILGIDARLPRDLWKCFADTRASDELYFPTALALLGILEKRDEKTGNDEDLPSKDVIVPVGEDVVKRRVTYADWSVGAKNPAAFSGGLSDLKKVAKLAREEGCLFARKFCPVPQIGPGERSSHKVGEVHEGQISVDVWRSAIESLAGSTGSGSAATNSIS